MKNALTILAIFLLLLVGVSKADCPTTASCAEHGIAGNPTGQYKWQGATQYAQFKHTAVGNAPAHAWWEKCD